MLIVGILASALSVGMGAMGENELEMALDNCLENDGKSACQALIDNGVVSVEQCGKNNCRTAGFIYNGAGHHREAILYFEKAIALGDNRAFFDLGGVYHLDLNDYFNAKEYYEIGCNKVSEIQAESCTILGMMYHNGEGVRQDYHKAAELYKKACDMKYADACTNLGLLYDNGLGVRQNYSLAKEYYGKGCDLGNQRGCDNYKRLHSQGVQ